MNPSGAAAPDAKVQAVLNYLRQTFSSDQVDHLPKPDEFADLFRVIRNHEVLHQLLVRRPFYDRYDDLSPILKQMDVNDLLKRAGTQRVELR